MTASRHHGVQPPLTYANATPAAWTKYHEEKAAQDEADVAFAGGVGMLIAEGPWDDAPVQQVAYVGIDERGNRTAPPAITSHWRFTPYVGSHRFGNAEKPMIRVSKPGSIMVRRIQLGRMLGSLVLEPPWGNSPVQCYGWIDAKELYFRSRGTHWSVDIGTDDAIRNSEWYHERYYGEWPSAGRVTSEEAESFILDAAEKFRAGVSTMTERTIDAGSASILAAIKSLTGN